LNSLERVIIHRLSKDYNKQDQISRILNVFKTYLQPSSIILLSYVDKIIVNMHIQDNCKKSSNQLNPLIDNNDLGIFEIQQ
jgi:hypothetical protein